MSNDLGAGAEWAVLRLQLRLYQVHRICGCSCYSTTQAASSNVPQQKRFLRVCTKEPFDRGVAAEPNTCMDVQD